MTFILPLHPLSVIQAARVLCPLFEAHGVDIVYNAHATIYERFHPITSGRYDSEKGVRYVVTGGGGYDMSLDASQLWNQVHPLSARIKSTNHFLLTSVAPDECRLTAIDNEDKVIDTMILTKPPEVLRALPAFLRRSQFG